MINTALEIIRYAGVFCGFFIASSNTLNPVGQFHILTMWLVLCLAGITGIESLFFGKTASESIGYAYNPQYQRQSGINNISVALVALIAHFMAWGLYADLSLLSVVLIFLFFSGLNHAWSWFKEGNKKLKNLSRPIMTFAIIAFVIPFILKAVSYQN